MTSIIISSFSEIQQFLSCVDIIKEQTVNNLDIRTVDLDFGPISVIQSGVGIKNARTAANYAVNNLKSKNVYCTGVGGALDAQLKIADIVIGQWVFSIKMQREIKLCIPETVSAGNTFEGGILTTNSFVNTSNYRDELYQKSHALVVDMETWGAAEICEKSGTSLYAVRSISDTKSDNLPALGYIFDSNGNINKINFIKYFSFSPYMLYKFIEFKYFKLPRASKALSDYYLRLFKNNEEI